MRERSQMWSYRITATPTTLSKDEYWKAAGRAI